MNPFLHLLKACGAQPPVGTWLSSADAHHADALAAAGFDWVLVDLLHEPHVAPALLARTLAATRLVPLVRVAAQDPSAIASALDAGLRTLLLAGVDSPAAARDAVAATRYPPEGRRPVVSQGRATRHGTAPEALLQAARETGVVLQLQSPEALAQLEAIAAVDGVDALFVDPGELAALAGHLGRPAHPSVVAQLSQLTQRARAAGIPIGACGATPEQAASQRAAGCCFVAVSSDLGLMMRGATEVLHALRGGARPQQVHLLEQGTQTAA